MMGVSSFSRCVLIVFLFGACAVETSEPATSGPPTDAPGGKADDGRPGPPDVIPDSYQLAIPADEAPDQEFSFCSEVTPFVSLPHTIAFADTHIECSRGDDCFRTALDGEAFDSAGFEFEMSSGGGEVTWGAWVTEENRPGTIAPGIYTVDVRLPEIPAYGRQTTRGRRPVNGLPLTATTAHYEIWHANGVDEIDVGLAAQRNEARWVSLGVYRFEEGDRAEVVLDTGSRPVPAGVARFRRLSDPNLSNAAWLSFLSANQYSHFWSLGPMLEEFGFGYEGEGERWRQCAVDRRYLRSLEWDARAEGRSLRDDEIIAIGSCVAAWWQSDASSDARAGTPYSLIAQFEQHLLQVADADMNIQFFTGGELDEDEFEFQAGSTQVLYAYHPGHNIAVFVFRGTETESEQLFQDVATDIDFFLRAPPEPYNDEWGKTHRGFMDAFREVEPMVMAKVQDLHPSTQIFITGHSLGAAVATLLGSRIVADMEASEDFTRYFLRGIYTFGSPRVGNREFASKYHGMATRLGIELFRVRNSRDLVTRVPINIPFYADYEHVGSLLYIDADGALELTPAQTSLGFADSLSNHSIDAYYRRLESGRHDSRFEAYNTCP